MIRLLLQKESPLADEYAQRIDPEPQLVAAAIAAFAANNEAHAEKCKAALEEMVFPAIVMVRSRPKFYIIPVTKALSLAVAEGTSPEVETHVSMCTVPSPYSTSCGMEVPKYRAIALCHLIAFKAVAESLWSNY